MAAVVDEFGIGLGNGRDEGASGLGCQLAAAPVARLQATRVGLGRHTPQLGSDRQSHLDPFSMIFNIQHYSYPRRTTSKLNLISY